MVEPTTQELAVTKPRHRNRPMREAAPYAA
jgi:hypothetical protein